MKICRAFSMVMLLMGLLVSEVRAQDSLIRIHHLTYDILYNLNYKCPSVVFWKLRYQDLGQYSRLEHKSFLQDPEDRKPRCSTTDYVGSGYHRGHLCPAGDRGAQKDWWADTFYMTNVAPMKPALNTGAWKSAEDECREMVRTGCSLEITVIPLWLLPVKQWFGKCRIRVPSHFYKKAHCLVHDGHTIHWLMINTDIRQYMPDCVISGDSARKVLQGVATVVNDQYSPSNKTVYESY